MGVIGRVKIFDGAVDDNKLDVTAANTVRLKAGGKYTIEDNDGVPLLVVENDTKKVKVLGGVQRI